MGLRLSTSNKQSPLLIKLPVDETCPSPSRARCAGRAHLRRRRREGERGHGRRQRCGDTGDARGDGAKPQHAAGCGTAGAAGRSCAGASDGATSALRCRTGTSSRGLSPKFRVCAIPDSFCLSQSAPGSAEAQLCRKKTSFLPLLGYVCALS